MGVTARREQPLRVWSLRCIIRRGRPRLSLARDKRSRIRLPLILSRRECDLIKEANTMAAKAKKAAKPARKPAAKPKARTKKR